MLEEFKKFALKGNVMDLAVGVVIGGAFGKIVTSLVNDIIMPLLGVLTGGINLKALECMLKEAKGDIPALSVKYGMFLQNIVDFLIIAFSIFMVIKMLNKFKKKEEPKPVAPILPAKEELLLTEIRDILKGRA
ncbi:MAG TPA: large-conductance mechanosensitive channel protein MscL [Clostridia bacterium]|nr:large-conductance mechanosensitive channel protein MscL [Clostridia bacterium]